MTARKRIAIYSRVSTDLQNVEMQLRDLRQYADQRGFEIVREFSDSGISGATERRPALDQLMIEARKRSFDAVLVWRFDRFARSTRHLLSALEEFRSLGLSFLSFSEALDTGSPLGQAMFTIVGAMAQLERDILKERIASGIRNARAKGKHLGRPKTRDDVAILDLRKRGYSIRKIAEATGTSTTSVQRALGVTKVPRKTG